MDCNKDEAIRSRGIAEQKFLQNDLSGAKKFALKAQHLFPDLEGLPQLIAVLDVHIVAQDKVNGVDVNWYGILQTDAMADDTTIRKQYRKLALILHPDKNKAVGAEGAFKLISEAWGVLSDKEKKAAHDARRGKFTSFANGFCNFTHFTTSSRPQSKKPAQKSHTFWTACPSCKNRFQYLRVNENVKVFCTVCHQPFSATEVNSISRDASWHPPGHPNSGTQSNAAPLFSEKPNHHHTGGSPSVPGGFTAWQHDEQSNRRTDDKTNSRTEDDASRPPSDQQAGGSTTSRHRPEQANSSATPGTSQAAAPHIYSNFQSHWNGHRSRTTANHSAAVVKETVEKVHDTYETVKREKVQAQKDAHDKVMKERMEVEKEAQRKEHRQRQEQKQKRKNEELEKQAKAAAHARKAFDKLFARERKPSHGDLDSESAAIFQCKKMDTRQAGNANTDFKSQAD